MTRARIWFTAVIVLATGGRGVTQEEIDLAHDLVRGGEVAELRALLAEKPAIASANIDEDCSLELVVDLRPAYPNMHETIEVLLEFGADPNQNAPDILRKAIWRREPEIVDVLLKHGADPTIVWPEKKIDMIEYAKASGDNRFEPIFAAWEATNRP